MTSIPMDPRLRARRIEVMRLQGRRRLRLVVTLVVATVALVVGWWLVTASPLLDVDEIEVRGLERTPVDAVIAQADIARGEALVEVDLPAAEQAVAALPWVDEVHSRRSVFGTVTIEVTEREPVAAVPGATGWLLVDRDGRVLEAVDSFDAGLAVVDGVRWNVAPGGWIGEGALGAIDIASSLPTRLRSQVASIHDPGAAGTGSAGSDGAAGAEAGLELVLFGGGRVQIGSPTELSEKYVATMSVLAQVSTRCLDRLDVRAPSVPVLTRVPDCS
ncbi:MAG: cell division protein FtsQ/DivIB [Acidimicrobiales bacterium]